MTTKKANITIEEYIEMSEVDLMKLLIMNLHLTLVN